MTRKMIGYFSYTCSPDKKEVVMYDPDFVFNQIVDNKAKLGISIAELARQTEYDAKYLQRVLSGKYSLTQTLAIQLIKPLRLRYCTYHTSHLKPGVLPKSKRSCPALWEELRQVELLQLDVKTMAEIAEMRACRGKNKIRKLTAIVKRFRNLKFIGYF